MLVGQDEEVVPDSCGAAKADPGLSSLREMILCSCCLSPLPSGWVKGHEISKVPLQSGSGWRAWNEPGDSAGRGI